MAIHWQWLVLAALYFTPSKQATIGQTSIDKQLERSYISESDHDQCVEAWAEVNGRQDRGCLGQAAVTAYEEKCKIPELQQRIRDLVTNCKLNKPKQFLAVSQRSEDRQHVEGEHSRSKRMVYADAWRLWPGGKVPYLASSASAGNHRAMRTMERFTCIRFYPWETLPNGTTTNDMLGLNHQSYVEFVYEGGCWADQGNKRHGKQKVSCCGGIVCLHELGHALGAYHEQSNPLGKGRIRLNPYNTESDKVNNFKPIDYSELGHTVYSSGYDITSLMAYPRGQFGNGKGSPIDYLFSDLNGGNDWYYLLEEISHVHHCDTLYCSHVTLTCENDGYLTLVDGVCGCRCPPGLDPSTGCTTPYTDASPAEKWPLGKYGLPKTKEGCPDSVFKTGSIIHTGAARGNCVDENPRGCRYWFGLYGCFDNPAFMNSKCPVTCNVCDTFGSHVDPHFALAGSANGDHVEDDVCVKEDTAGDDPAVTWPPGQYCLYRKGGACPHGMDKGSAMFSDENHGNAHNSVSGATVDGEFTASTTQFEFCCSKYGFEENELVLPRIKPFALLKSGDTSKCHTVRGMHAYDGYEVVRNKGGKPTMTGNCPVIAFDEGKNEWKIPYCYYVPTNKSCGRAIELTSANPTAEFEASTSQEVGCNWIIKAPNTSRVLLNFEQFNLAQNEDGSCIDHVTIRYDRLGQPGNTFCGGTFQKSISSVNNTLRVTFETFRHLQHPSLGNSYFKAKVSLINDANLCYTEAHKGRGYVGPVNYTRGMAPCLPWAQVAHCLHNPFKAGHLMKSLTDNQCRNPDLSDGFRPWCYTDATQCYRDYCDVCLFENLYDKYDDCARLAKLGFCENDPHVLENCAKTCKSNLPTFPVPNIAKSVSCPPPPPVSDGQLVDSPAASYSVGHEVTYRCNNQSQPTEQTRTCLSTGQWTTLNYVCTECDPGWIFHEGNCYILNVEQVNQPAAVSKCVAKGSELVTPKTKTEVDFIAGLSYWHGTWMDAHDVVEGTWRWADGSYFSWSYWAGGQPDNYGNEDCVWMQRTTGYFEDRWCDRDTTTYVCVKPAYAVATCQDVTGDCANFYANNPQACANESELMNIYCKNTCGHCSPATCTVEAPTANVQITTVTSIDQGESVEYQCKSGHRAVSGDQWRGCRADGSMTGAPLVCQPLFLYTTDTTMTKVNPWNSGSAKLVYTGDFPGLVIPADGTIARWEFWSESVGDGAFQVWRRTADPLKLEFIGQNRVTTPKTRQTTYYVPEAERIKVKKGDFIGMWWGDPMAGVGYTRCDPSEWPADFSHLVVTAVQRDTPDFQASSTYSFTSETKDTCRIYRFRAVVQS